jgi:hypothetical protein
MNIHLHINLARPQAIHRMQRRANKVSKFISDYVYYRKRNHSHIMAWRMAKNTL